LFEHAMRDDSRQMLMVLPLQSATRDWGALALLTEIDFRSETAADSTRQESMLMIAALERDALVQSLRESEERYALAATGTNDGLWDWDLCQKTVYFSPRWRQMLGYDEHEINSTPAAWFELLSPDDRPALEAAIARQLGGEGGHFVQEYRIVHKDGAYRWMLCQGVMVSDDEGRPLRLSGSQTDITRQKKIEERLARMAHHDPLTGLPNRILFHDRVVQALAAARREKASLSILLLDLDGFKKVNDTLGHAAGDRLLQAVATRIHDALPESDTAARMGGDEFAVLLPSSAREEALRTAENLIDAMSKPIRLEDDEVITPASVGVAVYPMNGESFDDLFDWADKAMYEMKRGHQSSP
jgi:diguanylate cyclase (GGDEF)-like protein/PAS domain S-box-containing protein